MPADAFMKAPLRARPAFALSEPRRAKQGTCHPRLRRPVLYPPQLAGFEAPAVAWEARLLPARCGADGGLAFLSG